MASDRGHEAVVRALTNKNADHTLKNQNQETALSLAVFSGQGKTAKPDKGKETVFHVRGERQRTLLQRAAVQNQILAITILVNLGEDLEAQNRNGCTPLHLAVTTGYVTTIKALIKLKANLEAQDNYGSTPLHLAASSLARKLKLKIRMATLLFIGQH
ncbi:hypothetical protein N7520_005200 [Penicillium odoratum]|uniref:uncharacterized protein n=1 Tax=Penicillium odoratum TaxID=1167516 RepID=UPI0025476CAA|nr:uncharacterized protein N7520_005200 [Penicillium odoratum]KAJ5765641.1 hypothetical protein N7520_005200 [Penicillium odoratum]